MDLVTILKTIANNFLALNFKKTGLQRRHAMKISSDCLNKMIEIRGIENQHLPLNGSLLAYDAILHIVKYQLEGSPLNYKRLFLSLNYSSNMVRQQIKKLIDADFISHQLDNDGRVRVLVPNDKLIKTLEDYLIIRSELYKDK